MKSSVLENGNRIIMNVSTSSMKGDTTVVNCEIVSPRLVYGTLMRETGESDERKMKTQRK